MGKARKKMDAYVEQLFSFIVNAVGHPDTLTKDEVASLEQIFKGMVCENSRGASFGAAAERVIADMNAPGPSPSTERRAPLH